MIFSLIKRDIKMSKKSTLIRFGIFFIIFTAYILLNIYRLYDYQIINSKSLILEIFRGCNYVEITGGVLNKIFEFPIIWLFINTFIIYAVGDYFYRDIKVNGRYVLIRVRKMYLIYIAKIVWSIFLVVLYYGLLLTIIGILGYLFSNNQYQYVDPNYFKIDTLKLIIYVFVLYSLTSVSLITIFITLTLKIKPVYCFLIDTALCVSSIFVESKLFIGQHNLLIRHVPFDTAHNFTIYNSIIFNVVITICLIIIGVRVSAKKEIF